MLKGAKLVILASSEYFGQRVVLLVHHLAFELATKQNNNQHLSHKQRINNIP